MKENPTIRIDFLISVQGHGIVSHRVKDTMELNYNELQILLKEMYREVKDSVHPTIGYENQHTRN